MSNLRLFAVGRIIPDVGTVIVSERDARLFGWAGFVDGVNAYLRGADLAEMQTSEQYGGWLWAQKRAFAGEPEEGAIEDDSTWIERGC